MGGFIKKKETITVAIPTYNSDLFIVDALRGVLSQTYTVDEILIVDDCSKDNTVNVIRNFILKNRIMNCKTIENNINLGYAKNWNKCLKLSSSKYTLILHADDILKPNTIEKQIHFFHEHTEVALVGGYEDFIDENGNFTGKSKTKDLRIYSKGDIYKFVKNTNSYISCSTVMFDMDKINQIGFFQENVLATDELYWPRILTKFPIAILGESLIERRIHLGQAEYSDFKNKSTAIIEASYEQYKIAELENRPKLRKQVKKLIQKKNATNGLKIAFKVLKSNHYLLFYKYIFFAIKQYPSIIVSRLFLRLIYHLIIGK